MHNISDVGKCYEDKGMECWVAEVESETILGKMVKKAFLGSIRVKTRIMIDDHGKSVQEKLYRQREQQEQRC